MLEQLKDFWLSMDEETAVVKKVLFLELLVAALAGIVIGLLASPRKNVEIACNNGSNNWNGIDDEVFDDFEN